MHRVWMRLSREARGRRPPIVLGFIVIVTGAIVGIVIPRFLSIR